MSAYQATYDILKADSAVLASVGDDIYLREAPQPTSPPYIQMDTILTGTTFSKSGASKLDIYRIDLEVYHDDLTQAESVANECISALDNYTGTINGVIVQRIHLEGSEPEKEIDNDPYWSLSFEMRKGR